MQTRPANPARYAPSVETPEKDEAETSRQLSETLHGILETTSKDYDHAVRSVHAKGHGLVRGKLTVKDGLPPELAQGLFAHAGSYDAILRFSTNPGDILDDSISVPRGLAIKLVGVEGDRLPGSEDDATQDFILVNGPVFAAPDAKHFLANLKPLAATTDKAEGLKKLISGALRATDAVLSTVGIESAKIRTMGGAPNVHPLGETYYAQTAFRYGDHIAKFSLVPVSPNLTELTGSKVTTTDRPDALREEIREVLVERPAEWQFCVQLCADLEEMPIEDATVLWDEETSPFIPVATLTVKPQLSWEPGVSEREEDGLSFSIWHGLAAHQPLGSINRVRKPTYEMSADFRAKFNGCRIHEPA